jgi:prepilin-type N-terminal cleavage/methylation domain-containing protein
MVGHRRVRSGFTLIELLVVIAIIALLIGILLPALGEARKSGRLTLCLSSMKQLGTSVHSYAADYQDKLASFTVTAASADRLSYPDLRAQAGGIDTAGAAAQAVDIIRRRTGDDGFPQIDGWIPHVLYTHLVLQDYLAARLPEKSVVCPEDRIRLLWQDVRGFRAGSYPVPRQADGPPPEDQWRWSYSSSYEFVPSSYSPDNHVDTVGQAGTHYQYLVPGTPNFLGKRKLSEVAFPSGKIHLMDSAARHFGKKSIYYAYSNSRVPLLAFDSSVNVKGTGTPVFNSGANRYEGSPANPGANPRQVPQSSFYFTYTYSPDTRVEPATRSGAATETVIGYYRWTRQGLRGVDYGGAEVK